MGVQGMRARTIAVIAALGWLAFSALTASALHAQSVDGEADILAEHVTVKAGSAELDPDWYLTLPPALYASSLGVAMRESWFLYPLINVVHLIGLVIVVGAIALLDLRLLGLARRVPVAPVYPILTRIAAIGIVVQLTSGVMLFAAEATTLMRNDAFLLKMSLLGAALANAGLFRLLWRSHVANWDDRPPLLGLAQAALSLLLWLSIAVLGRLIAYL